MSQVRLLLHELKAAARQWRRRRGPASIFEKFHEFTMIPERAYSDNLLLAEGVRHVPGCVIECGVWRGGMSAGLAMVLGAEREYFLFDSFEGLPPPKEIDGEAALAWKRDVNSPWYFDNCKAPAETAEQAMRLAGARHFHLCTGWFDKTLPGFVPPGPIALLRLDGDWYESTMVCLEHLYDHVAPGGLIMFDDYHTWEGCGRALHDFLSRKGAPERIRTIGDICYLTKRAVEEKDGVSTTSPKC
jgi:O-methyltransferase